MHDDWLIKGAKDMAMSHDEDMALACGIEAFQEVLASKCSGAKDMAMSNDEAMALTRGIEAFAEVLASKCSGACSTGA